MPVPPNLPTTHVNDLGEFINAGDIDDLATAVNSLPIVVSTAYFGADPTGVGDSTAAFNNALAALPATNGTVYAPPGNYRIDADVIKLGNGSATGGPSTRHGMRIVGAAPPGPFWGSGFPAQGATRLFTTAAKDIIHVNGPVAGWGLQNLHLDGGSVGTTGVKVLSGQSGGMDGVSFTNFTSWTASFSCMAPAETGVMAGINTNTEHNIYRNIHFLLSALNNAAGILWTGAGEPANTITCGTSNELWEQVSMTFTPTSGKLSYGLYYQVCAEVVIRNLRFLNAGATQNGAITSVIDYDYTLGQSLYPSDNLIDTVDFQTNNISIINSGLPASSSNNKIVNICSHAGRPPNPNLIGLAWGYSNASP